MSNNFIDNIMFDMMTKVHQMRSDEFFNGQVVINDKEKKQIYREREAKAFLKIAEFIEYRSVLIHSRFIALIPGEIRFQIIKDMINHIDNTLELLETSNDVDEIEDMMHEHETIDDFITYVKYGFNISILRAFVQHFHSDKEVIDTLDYYNDKSYFNEFSIKYADNNFSEDWNLMRSIYLAMVLESKEFSEFNNEIEEGFINGSSNYPHELRLFTYNDNNGEYSKSNFHHVDLDFKNKTIDIDYAKTFQYSEYKDAIAYLKEVIKNK